MTIDAPTCAQLPHLRQIWQEAFGDSDEFWNTFQSTAFSFDRCRCASVDGEVAAMLYWFDCLYAGHRIAYLYAIATAKAFRGQGLCHRLMEHTHKHLKNLGYTGTILVPASPSLFNFYQSMGYRTCAHVDRFTCAAAESGIALQAINCNEYAKLRRRFLPPEGVIQENENLEFLQTMTDLYTGNGFLLAARQENATLLGIGLLGDQSVAPRLVRALNCQSGSFQTPRGNRPFAMYCPLDGGKAPAPNYFGLAFD